MEKYNKSSKYDDLNPRKELEQEIAKDLENALAKRGFTVQHSGTSESHAPANKPDIELFDNTTHINVEITKSRKSAQDREWQSIKDHFQTTKRKHSNKKCYLMFISPETYYRTKDSIMDWNYQHNNVSDQKIIPISFFAFEKITIKLIQTTKENYTKKEILEVFGEFTKFNNDESVFRILAEKLLHDAQLQKMIEAKEEEMRQQTIEKMITGFKKLEKKLRDEHIALSGDAIKTVIYLVFIKLYEEKKEKEGSEQSRLTLESFRKYQKAIRDNETAIHTLFSSIKGDNEIKASRLLTPSDTLESRLNDDFVIEHFIMLFEQYIFFTPKVDGLGAAYEVLGQLSSKDTRAGQFFTPDNVVAIYGKTGRVGCR